MRLLLLSNSKVEGMDYLEYAQGFLRDFLDGAVGEALFLPYAMVTRSYDDYVGQVRSAFRALGVDVTGIHAHADPIAAVRAAPAIVVGGGSTWKLLRDVRNAGLLHAIRDRVASGVPYIGWSAGANLACPTIMTTNDMPICDPGGFDALGLVPFQVNPHYLHGNPPGHKGETREEQFENALYVLSVARKMGAHTSCGYDDIMEVRPRAIMLLCASLVAASDASAVADGR